MAVTTTATATATPGCQQRSSRRQDRLRSPFAAASATGAAAALLLLVVLLLGTCGLGLAAPAGPAAAPGPGPAGGGRSAGAATDDTRCRGALKLQTDPSVQAFKKCANKTPIPMDCCLKMIPFAPYADCLQMPQYKSLADSFLAPTVTVDRALRECLG